MANVKQITISHVLKELTTALIPISKEEAALEARLLICHVLGIDTARLLQKHDELFPEKHVDSIKTVFNRRKTHEPIQYILGEWEFMGLPINVRNCALIPRQDTETLAEHALTLIKEKNLHTVLDLCCGTGCIGISLAKLEAVTATFGDISNDCIMLTRENAQKNGIMDAQFAETDMFSAISESYDMIVCNPPYLTKSDMGMLQSEVRFEPSLALFGGDDGLNFYKRLAGEYDAHLNNGGCLLMEVGISQSDDIMAIFGGGYAVKDICGAKRVVVIEKKA